MAKKPIIAGQTGLEQIGSSDALCVNGGLAVGQTTDPDASAIGEFESTTKGFLLPRMSNTQRNSISSPAQGLAVFNTNIEGCDFYSTTRSRYHRAFQASGTPSFTLASGWGTGASSSIEGTDLAGKITITTGTGTLTITNMGTLNFNTAFPASVKYAIFLTAANASATGANMGAYLFCTSLGDSGFVIDASNSNVSNRVSVSTTYTIFYHVVQYE